MPDPRPRVIDVQPGGRPSHRAEASIRHAVSSLRAAVSHVRTCDLHDSTRARFLSQLASCANKARLIGEDLSAALDASAELERDR